jgi:hypothetical protein
MDEARMTRRECPNCVSDCRNKTHPIAQPCGECNCGKRCPRCRSTLGPGPTGDVYPCGNCRYDPRIARPGMLAMPEPSGTFPIPVGATAWQALKLPFQHPGLFMRLAVVPLAMIVAVQVAGGFLAENGPAFEPLVLTDQWAFYALLLRGHWAFYGLWLLIFWVVSAPFWVGWTRFSVLGTEGVSDYSWFTFRARELKCLAAFLVITVLVAGPILLCVYIGYALHWSVSALVLAAVIGVAEIVVGLRFTFVLPAIALDSFAGVRSAWNQTRSTILRIMGAIFLTFLPINCGGAIVHRAERSAQLPSSLIVLGLLGLLLVFLSLAVEVGAIAICYRFRTGLPSTGAAIRKK